MKKDIGFIAIGQGGGNIGQLFEEAGHTVLNMNTAPQDLATLTKAKHKYLIKGGEGCNKDRDKAKVLVMNDFDEISNRIEQTLKEEYLFAIFTAGGGTGSGASPMLIDLLRRKTGKTIGAICVLPSREEPLKTFINCYECFKELEEIDGIGATFILDNKKAEKFQVNKDFVDLFGSFIDIPNQQSFRGNIDVAEIKTMLSVRGAAIISKLTKATSDTSRLIQSFSQNIFAPMERNGYIAYLGLSSATQLELPAISKEVGLCLDIFQGENAENTVCGLFGLTYPYTELEKMKASIEGNRDAITKSLTATSEKKLADGINFLNSLQKPMAAQPQSKEDVADVFAKYLKS